VGGLAAVAQGAPLTTHDVDIVPRRSVENIDRLLAVLESIDAQHRGSWSGGPLRPDQRELLGTGHSLLMTSLRPLDVLGAIEGGRDYESLLPDSIEIDVGGHPIRVLSLAVLVELKRASTHPKDRYALAILEETLRQQREG